MIEEEKMIIDHAKKLEIENKMKREQEQNSTKAVLYEGISKEGKGR